MGGRFRAFLTTVLAISWLGGWSSPAFSQGRVSTPATSSSLIDLPSQQSPAGQSSGDALTDANTFVSFLDSAIVRSQERIRFDDATRIRRPTRDEYFQPKGGLPYSPGPALPETNLDYQQLSNYVEVAIVPQFSVFLNTPLRWVNADVNRDPGGLGDIDLGLKWAFWSTSSFVATGQLRVYVPTAADSSLGTEHVSVEPAFLFNYSLLGFLTLEGDARLWVPIAGTDFAGEVVQYGLGISYGQKSANNIWLAPVVEAVGWTVLNGKTLVPEPTSFLIQNAAGTTIVNLNAGLRLGLGSNASVYAGYGRALTGPAWYKDIWRLEFRLFF